MFWIAAWLLFAQGVIHPGRCESPTPPQPSSALSPTEALSPAPLGPVVVHPREPANGATVGARPLFRFQASNVRAGWESSGAITVALSRDRWKTVERRWSITGGEGRGWMFSTDADGVGQGSFRAPEELGEGAWEWRVTLGGAEDLAGPPPRNAHAFRVDATPPAEVASLKVTRRPDGSILLAWPAVTTDIEGNSEAIASYAIYRYDARGIFTQSAPRRIGVTRTTQWIDRTPAPARAGSAALYYRVVAIDAAGNELGVRDRDAE